MSRRKTTPPVRSTRAPDRKVDQDTDRGLEVERDREPERGMYREADRDWTDRAQLEDALIEVIKTRAARLRRSGTRGNARKHAIRMLRADGEIVKAILGSRQEMVAMMEQELSSLRQKDGKGPTPEGPPTCRTQ